MYGCSMYIRLYIDIFQYVLYTRTIKMYEYIPVFKVFHSSLVTLYQTHANTFQYTYLVLPCIAGNWPALVYLGIWLHTLIAAGISRCYRHRHTLILQAWHHCCNTYLTSMVCSGLPRLKFYCNESPPLSGDDLSELNGVNSFWQLLYTNHNKLLIEKCEYSLVYIHYVWNTSMNGKY